METNTIELVDGIKFNGQMIDFTDLLQRKASADGAIESWERNLKEVTDTISAIFAAYPEKVPAEVLESFGLAVEE